MVFTGAPQLWNEGKTHAQSGDQGWWFDFSAVTDPGSYYVYDLRNQVGSARFDISTNMYDEVLEQAVRMFYYQRVNYAKQAPYAGAWTDEASFEGPNQDRAARNVNDKDNPQSARDLHGGWYDAGDLNKYTTFTLSPVVQMLEAYRRNPNVFKPHVRREPVPADQYDNAQTSAVGPAPGYLTGGPNKENYPINLANPPRPPFGQPQQKSYRDWNTDQEEAYAITEPGIYYQGAYVALLSRLISTGGGSSTSPPSPPVASGPRYVYRDALAEGWQNWSWSTDIDFEASCKLATIASRVPVSTSCACVR